MAEIEQLTIGIEAEAKTANKVVENLSNKIGLLADALNRVDTGKLSGIATGIRKLSDAAVGFKGAKSTELSSLASTLKKFDGIDTNSLYGISSSMKALSDGIKSAQGVDTSGFSNVVSSISKLGGTKATSGTQNLIKIKDDLARFVDGMNRVESLTFDTSNLSNLLSGIKGLGSKASSDATKNLPTISAQFQNFVRQMNKIGSLTFDTSNLSSLISSISKMGGKGVSAAVGNIPKLAEAMKDLMTTLSRAPTVSQNVIDMANALAQLGKAGSGIGTATNSISKMSVTTIRASGKVKNALKGMQGGFRSLLRTFAPLIGAFQLINFGKQAMEISSDLTEVQNVVDVTFGDFKNKIEDLAKVSITDFGMSELTAKQISSRFQAMGTAMGFAQGEMADMSVNLTKLAADMASFYNVEQEDVARSMQSIFTGETEPLRKYGLDLTQATLQEWAHKQGIDAKMQSMSQMEKTMLRYQYVLANTGAAAKDFQRTSESWANQVRILKQNFEQLASVIGGVLINAFKPVVKAVNAAMGAIIAFAKTISNALGQIFGWTYEESGGGFAQEFDNAAAGAGAIEDATGGAADNIKKMQAGLRAFDELKVINMPDNNQGGSGGGGGGTGGAGGGAEAAGGKWVQGESILKKYQSEIDTLYKLGEHIGKTLTDAMNNIDWDSVYQKAENFGKGLADFLNGLISPELFGATGRTIAGALNTVLYSLKSFGEEFDWKDFGLSIATGINNFFITYDFSSLANALNTWTIGVLDSVIESVEKTEWGMIGEKIGIFLAEINWIDILKSVGKTIWDAIKASLELWAGSFSAAPIETAFLTILALPGIVGFGSKLIGLIVNPFKNIFGLLSPIISGIGGLFAEGGVFGAGGLIASASAPVIALTAAFAALVVGLGYVFATNEEVRESFSKSTSAIRDGLQPAIDFVTNTLLPDLNAGWERLMEILSPLGNFLNDMFVSIWQDMINPALSYVGKTILPELTNAFENLWNNVIVPFCSVLADTFEPAIQILSDTLTILWQNVIIPLAEAIGSVFGTAFEALSDLFNNVVVPGIQTVIDTFQFLWDNVLSPIVTYLWENYKPAFEEVFNAIGIIIENLGNVFSGLIDLISGVLSGDWQRAWEGIKAIFSSIWEAIKGIASSAVNIVKNVITGAWNNIKTVTSTIWNCIKIFVSGLWNGLKSNVSNVFGGIKTTITNIWEGIKTVTTNVWNGIMNAVKVPINAIIGFINGMVSGVVSGMNGMINALNRLSFDVPDWVPLIGGKTFGFNIGNISAPQIPYLAKGAVFRGGEPFLAVVNDQKRGQTNIEAPLKTIQEAVRIELDKFSANSRMAMPDTSMYSYRPMTAPEMSYIGAYGSYHDTSAYMAGGYNGGNSGILGMSETALYNLFYNSTSAAIANSKTLTEQNEILEGILEKPTIGQDDIGKNAVKYIQGEEQRLQKSLVGIY